MARRQRGNFDLLVLVSILFFISGSTGLAYEVIWSKRFTHVWGSSTLAMASVVASFLFGLGLGALLIGRVSDRLTRPLFWYGVAEIAIGVLAAIIPFEILALSDLAIAIHPRLPDVESVRFLVRCGLTLLVIGPPCVLMGGTLPLLIRQFTPRDGQLGAVVGWLYAINTFGAATGCAAAGFYLLPTLDLQTTNYLTATVNLAIGGVSIALSAALADRLRLTINPRDAAAAREKQPDRPAPQAPRHPLWAVYTAVGVTGLAALVLQMVWVRQLSLILGGSTYAFTATLFIVLVAIALGSLIYQLALQRFLASYLLPIVVICVLATSALVGTLLLPQLSMTANEYRTARADWGKNAGLCILIAAAVQLLPGTAMGILFPLLVDLTRQAAAVVGRTVGNVYAWNTLGSILGATFTSFYLIPWLGTIGTVGLAIALYLLAGGLLLVPLGFSWRKAGIWAGYAAAACLLVGGVWRHAQTADPMDTNFGLYMYDPAQRRQDTKVIYFREGASSNVLVAENINPANPEKPARSLRVNGKVDASTGMDMHTQLGLAVFPRFFNPTAAEVLVIGFGSGTTTGASLLFPDTHVTCCEIEPAVFGASELFSTVNHSPERYLNDRFEMVFGDGRTVLQTSAKKFDLIISEPSNPWLAGVSNLFTREFFEAAREHLNEGGVLAQWIQTYNFTVAEYALIVRTLQKVFPHSGVVSLSMGADTILLASEKPLLPSSHDVEKVQEMIAATPELAGALAEWFKTVDARQLLVQYYRLDEEGLRRFVAADVSEAGRRGEINTDLNLKLEFDAPLRLFAQSRSEANVAPAILRSVTPHWPSELAIALGYAPASSNYFMAMARAASERQQFDTSIDNYRRAIETDPTEAAAYFELGALYQRLKRGADAAKVMADVLQKLHDKPLVQQREAELRLNLAGLLTEQKRHAESIEQYRAVLRLAPNSPIAANNLAWLLATSPKDALRDGREALRLAQQACEATSNSVPGFLDTLAAAYAEVGDFDEALRLVQAATEAARQRKDASLEAAMQSRRERYQQRLPFREG